MNETKKARLIFLVIIISAIAIGAGAFYFIQKYLASSETYSIELGNEAEETPEQVIEKIGKLILLPEGEVPTVATVSDPEQLRDQPFFAKAKEGYKVLIYTNAKKGILYDPISNKIIEVAPLSISTSQLQ